MLNLHWSCPTELRNQDGERAWPWGLWEHQGWNTYQRGGSGAVSVASWSGRDASSWGSGFSLATPGSRVAWSRLQVRGTTHLQNC